MAKVGDVIENLVSGQRLIFRKTIEDTGGKLLEVDSLYTKPTPSRPPTPTKKSASRFSPARCAPLSTARSGRSKRAG